VTAHPRVHRETLGVAADSRRKTLRSRELTESASEVAGGIAILRVRRRGRALAARTGSARTVYATLFFRSEPPTGPQ